LAEAKKPPQDATSKADTMALLAEAEAEVAEAEALAVAARARARAARLRRELQDAEAEPAAETLDDEAKTDADVAEIDEDATDTDETETAEEVTESDDEPEIDEASDTDESDHDVTEFDDVTETDDDEAGTEEEVTDETGDDTEEDAESESEPARSRRRRWLPSLAVAWKAAAIILICGFVGASGYMLWQRHETNERNQRTANFVAGARQGVINMFSLDFNRAKDDVQRVLDSSTGQFRDDLQQRSKDFTTVVEQSKVVTQGSVSAAAVQSIDGNSALVIVAASSRITNAAGAKDEQRNWRLKVTVTEDAGQYKMSKLEFVP
jgi:Mce-associated membrane protein